VKDEVVEVSIEEPDTDMEDYEDQRLDFSLQMSQPLQQVCILQIQVLLVSLTHSLLNPWRYRL
jgi:hypothetical protein